MMMMTPYPKTYGPFNRYQGSKPHIRYGWTKPEFEVLQDCYWEIEEKLDGTNMRIIYDGELKTVEVRGRTDKSVIFKSIQDYVGRIQDRLPRFTELFGDNYVCLYGEGIGEGIQNGGKRYGDPRIVIFDIFSRSRVYYRREDMRSVSYDLGFASAPYLGKYTLNEAIEQAREGFRSEYSADLAEGVIARPSAGLLNRHGERIICKIKHRDFLNESV